EQAGGSPAMIWARSLFIISVVNPGTGECCQVPPFSSNFLPNAVMAAPSLPVDHCEITVSRGFTAWACERRGAATTPPAPARMVRRLIFFIGVSSGAPCPPSSTCGTLRQAFATCYNKSPNSPVGAGCCHGESQSADLSEDPPRSPVGTSEVDAVQSLGNDCGWVGALVRCRRWRPMQLLAPHDAAHLA